MTGLKAFICVRTKNCKIGIKNKKRKLNERKNEKTNQETSQVSMLKKPFVFCF